MKQLCVKVSDELFAQIEEVVEKGEPPPSRSEIIRRALAVGIATLMRRTRLVETPVQWRPQ